MWNFFDFITLTKFDFSFLLKDEYLELNLKLSKLCNFVLLYLKEIEVDISKGCLTSDIFLLKCLDNINFTVRLEEIKYYGNKLNSSL